MRAYLTACVTLTVIACAGWSAQDTDKDKAAKKALEALSATVSTSSSCPVRHWSSVPLTASQTRTVRSWPPLPTRVPSALHATLITASS